jgi:hypothetical protein
MRNKDYVSFACSATANLCIDASATNQIKLQDKVDHIPMTPIDQSRSSIGQVLDSKQVLQTGSWLH